MLLYALAQSLSHLIVHAVFSTNDRRALLRSEEIRSETYSYMAADLIGRVKGSSSKRLSEKGVLGFAWQNGYGAFSVSESLSRNVIFGNNDRPSAALSGRFLSGRLPRAEAHGLFCFRPSGDPKCPNLQAA